MTSLLQSQLLVLYRHLRIPDILSCEDRYRFTGEEFLLHFMVYVRIGETKLRMSTNYFGGDPRRFTYSIRLVANHLYVTFYNKISGDSMGQWTNKIDIFRYAIWEKMKINNNNSGTASTGNCNNQHGAVNLNIPFESFRIFGFADDAGFRTTAPGRQTRQRLGYAEDVQRAFYSGYFTGHGLKVQTVSLPNGLFGSAYVAPLRVSDAGLQNMSGLDHYLTTLFLEYNKQLPHANYQLLVVFCG